MSRPNLLSTDKQRLLFAKKIKSHVGKGTRITSEVIAEEWYGVTVNDSKDSSFVRGIVHWLRRYAEIEDKHDSSRVRVLCADDDGYFLAESSLEAFSYGVRFHRRNRSQILAEEAVWEGAEDMLAWEEEHEST